MKNISFFLAGLSLLSFHQLTSAVTNPDNPNKPAAIQGGTAGLKLSSTPELYSLSRNWVNGYVTAFPSSKITLAQISDGTGGVIENLSLISDENSAIISNPSNWKIVVGREVIVPIVNGSNPMIHLLQQAGISSDKFASLFANPDGGNWSALVANGQKVPVQLYLTNDEALSTRLGLFAKAKVETKKAKIFASAAEMIKAVQSDQYAIGFCKLNDLNASLSAAGSANISLLPIDKNGNGRLDNFENIYANLQEFTHGVWIGKYPKSLSNNIYAVSASKPEAESELAFLSWIMADGQQLLGTSGFCDLTSSEKQSNMASLLGTTSAGTLVVNTASTPETWPIVLTVAACLGLFLAIFFYSKKRSTSVSPDQEIEIAPRLIEQAVNVPQGLYFGKSHTWAFMEQDGNVRIGIDDFLQHITGKLTRIKMMEAGEKVRKGETIMTIIQEGKQLNIYAPISGTILAQNESLLNDTTIINSSPFFKGWVYQIEPKNWLREAQFMLMGEQYKEWLRDEFARLKDFIASSVKTNELAYAHVILQDGGELTDNVLAGLEPKVWEDFQTRFIDTSR